MDFYEAGVDSRAMPSPKEISRTRSNQSQQTRVTAPAETPAELVLYRDGLVRQSNPQPWEMWTLPDFSIVDETCTIVPFCCDYMVSSAVNFINAGVSLQNNQSVKVSRLVGDATPDESHQRLKKLRLSFAGHHFAHGQWSNTQIPVMECVCNDESIDAIKMTLHALAYVLLVHGNGLVLKDHVVACFWDGKPEALNVLLEYFGFPCRLCLQHSKKNTEARYTG